MHCLQQTAIYMCMGSYFPSSGAFDCKTVSFVILIPTEFKTARIIRICRQEDATIAIDSNHCLSHQAC